jgi:hypothetical protein
MVLSRLFASRWTRLFSVLSVVVTGLRAVIGGNRRLGVLLLGVAALAYRWSPVGIALTLLYHRYGDRITSRALDGDTA